MKPDEPWFYAGPYVPSGVIYGIGWKSYCHWLIPGFDPDPSIHQIDIYNCLICGSDCAGANPPVVNCPSTKPDDRQCEELISEYRAAYTLCNKTKAPFLGYKNGWFRMRMVNSSVARRYCYKQIKEMRDRLRYETSIRERDVDIGRLRAENTALRYQIGDAVCRERGAREAMEKQLEAEIERLKEERKS